MPAVHTLTLPPLTADAIARLTLPADGILVLRGGPDAFSRGMHLDDGLTDAGARVAAFGDLLRRLDAAPTPVVAVVDGEAHGGGAGLAAVADWVIAGPGARFSLPEALIGLIPGVVLPYLARRMGPAAARRLALGGPTLDARAAVAAGLADVATETPDAALSDVLGRLGRLDPGAVASLRALFARGFGPPPDQIDDAARRFADLAASPATRLRIARWLDGDAPWEDA